MLRPMNNDSFTQAFTYMEKLVCRSMPLEKFTYVNDGTIHFSRADDVPHHRS